MILYIDTSALVKLYAREPESELVGSARVTAVSLLAFAEARAAFARKHRERAVNPKDYRRIVREFSQSIVASSGNEHLQRNRKMLVAEIRRRLIGR